MRFDITNFELNFQVPDFQIISILRSEMTIIMTTIHKYQQKHMYNHYLLVQDANML
jgi:hypothetical protein